MTAPIEDRPTRSAHAGRLYADGLTVREVAARLGLGYGTTHDLIRESGQRFRSRGRRGRR
jgi:transposase